MDYEDASDGFLLGSIIFDHPLISIPLLIIGCIFAYKACIFEDECSHKKCSTGTPMVVRGECLCTERAR